MLITETFLRHLLLNLSPDKPKSAVNVKKHPLYESAFLLETRLFTGLFSETSGIRTPDNLIKSLAETFFLSPDIPRKWLKTGISRHSPFAVFALFSIVLRIFVSQMLVNYTALIALAQAFLYCSSRCG